MQLDRPDREKIYENVAKVQLETKVTKTYENCQVEVLPLGGLCGFDCTTHWSKPLLRLCHYSIVPPTHASLIESNPGASQRCLCHSSPRSAGPQIPTNPIKSLECTSAHQCTSRIEWKFVNTVAVTRLVNSERTQCTLQFSKVQLLTAPAILGSHTFLDLLRCPADSGTSPRTRHGPSP